jgi:hypothetical protein
LSRRDRARDVHQRQQIEPQHGIVLAGLRADAELQLLALARHVERAERPIPDRQREAEILADMRRIGAVVDLMMRRALHHVGERTENDSHTCEWRRW